MLGLWILWTQFEVVVLELHLITSSVGKISAENAMAELGRLLIYEASRDWLVSCYLFLYIYKSLCSIF